MVSPITASEARRSVSTDRSGCYIASANFDFRQTQQRGFGLG